MKEILVEFLGTFTLALFICLAVTNAGDSYGLAIGIGLMALVYMGIKVSGAHYNPAVTLSMMLRAKIGGAMAVAYILAQFAAAISAGALFMALYGNAFYIGPGYVEFNLAIYDYKSWPITSALMVEIIFSFFLVYTINEVAATERNLPNSYHGLAIGAVVLVGIYSVGPISGAAFNPAIGIGLAVLHKAAIGHAWIYLAGPVIGSLLATLCYRITNPQEFL
jgi:aquaporin Z